MQRDFCSPGGYADHAGMDISRMQAVVGQVQRLLQAARAAGLLVVHTREGHPPDMADCSARQAAAQRRCGCAHRQPGPTGPPADPGRIRPRFCR